MRCQSRAKAKGVLAETLPRLCQHKVGSVLDLYFHRPLLFARFEHGHRDPLRTGRPKSKETPMCVSLVGY